MGSDEQILKTLEAILTRLDVLQQDISTIREAVAPDLDLIIAMHQGKHTATEASGNPKKGDGHERT